MNRMNAEKIRCIALDLDRTTLDARSRLSDGNRQALEYAISRGVHVVIASGRSFDTLPEDVMAVPGLEYAVTSNGAAVWHIPSRTCIQRHLLPEVAVRAVLELTEARQVTYEGFIDGVAYGDAEYVRDPERFGAVPQGVAYVKATRRLMEDIRGFLLEHVCELESMDVVVPGEPERQEMTRRIAENVPGIYITSSAPQLVELSNEKAGKHTGVAFVAERLGLTRMQVAAFGDGDNDADLLTYAGCGIAVANASPACRAAADRVTLHHDADGVAHGIYRILNL